MIDISVVIPSYNARESLLAQLRSLEASDFSKDRFEIVVGDDGSTDGTDAAVLSFASQSAMRIIYVRRERDKTHGAGLARNAAMTQASGRIIAFSDADCLVDPQWLTVIAQEILGQGKAFISGAVASDQVLIFPWRDAPAGHRGVTANMAFDSKKTGPTSFDEAFQNFLCEDTDFVCRLQDRGFVLIHVPEMKVMHPAKTYGLVQMAKRALSRKNEVLLHKKYGTRVETSMHPLFRPMVVGHVSPVFLAGLGAVVLAAKVLATEGTRAYLVLAAICLAAALWFLVFGYRFCVYYRPAGSSDVSWHERFKTLFFLVSYTPFFLWARMSGSWKERYILL